MKKFFSIYVVLLITAFISMVSCTKEEIMTENEIIEVGLNIKTNRLPLASEIPLTKGASTDIYGLNIYEYKDDFAENPYCYGLFTSLDKLTIKFRKGYKYFIMIDYIPNGQNIIGFNVIRLKFFNMCNSSSSNSDLFLTLSLSKKLNKSLLTN